jgi:hypothetical protein
MDENTHENLQYLEEAFDELKVSPTEMLVMLNQMTGMLSAATDPHLWRGTVDRAVLACHEHRNRTH